MLRDTCGVNLSVAWVSEESAMTVHLHSSRTIRCHCVGREEEGVDNANMAVLQKLQGSIPAMKLNGTKFSSFFKWLSASFGTVVNAENGQKVDLSDGVDSWMEAFTI